MNKSTKAMIAGAALAGLCAGSVHAATSTTSTTGSNQIKKAGAVMGDPTHDNHACAGQNACKGKGGCKTGDAGCKGKNSCKGKGGCATDKSKKK